MKNTFRVIACMAALAAMFTAQSASAQDNQLEGVWKYIEIVPPGPNTQPTQAMQPGLLMFTRTHYSMVMINGDKPRPDLPQQDATDAQKVATWTPFSASAGTYEVKGNTYTFRTTVAKNPSAMQPDLSITVEFEIDGNTLITTPKAINTVPINWGSTKLVRVE
jgi:hypothetical protein